MCSYPHPWGKTFFSLGGVCGYVWGRESFDSETKKQKHQAQCFLMYCYLSLASFIYSLCLCMTTWSYNHSYETWLAIQGFH